jgi:hypothetical protein
MGGRQATPVTGCFQHVWVSAHLGYSPSGHHRLDFSTSGLTLFASAVLWRTLASAGKPVRMPLLDKLQRRFGHWAVPNVTLVLIFLQVVVYALSYADPTLLEKLILIPQLVLQGEGWRLFTFMAIPPRTNILFAIIFWNLFYVMGTALEQTWGTFRYNIFLLVGFVASVSVAFFVTDQPANNLFLQGSVFLAFAYLYPDFEVLLFFVMPVKVKWLALLTWAYYGSQLLFGDWMTRMMVLASSANFLLFFHRDIYRKIRSGQHRMVSQAREVSRKNKPFHRCTTCGITDKTNPDMEFRYCAQCEGTYGYCSEHIHNHEHIESPQTSESH